MTTLEFESRPQLLSPPAISTSPFRHIRRIRKRLALISTCDDLCGIAAYTRSLEKQLSSVFDVTVFNLDQYLFCAAPTAASENSPTGTSRTPAVR
jgi:hypothetical protein